MNLIIGSKTSEGIVLIGDTKITGGHRGYQNKILRLNLGDFEVLIGYSGWCYVFDKFKLEIEQINPKTRKELIEHISVIMKKIHPPDQIEWIDILLGLNTQLYYFK